MLFFAVRRRSAVDEATGPRSPWKKGAGGALVAKAVLPYCFFTVCGGLAWVATRTGNMGSAVRRCSTFVRIKRVLATHRRTRPISTDPARFQFKSFSRRNG